MSAPTQNIVRLRPAGWPAAEHRLAMPTDAEAAAGISVTNRCLYRDGVPWIPITGEMHFSRMPRSRWAEALRLMRAGGITVVATYIFWIHHQPDAEAEARFDGSLDVAEFVRLAAATGLDVVLRIGPWCHGEARNGGHPDWVVEASYEERTDDPAYLDHVRTWFGHLGHQLGPLCSGDGPVIAIQLENELYTQREHILTLKSIARESGLHAPLWTATAWGGADIPVGEVFPLYGGYADGFWVDTEAPWDDDFRSQFDFSPRWDTPAIGADLADPHRTVGFGQKHPDFPAAMCELGGGMASAYHRRPSPSARDIAAVAHTKLGSGSAWQGYYMYVGGTNPRGRLPMQESHATGYPNDLPERNYDFGAPIGAHLQTRESFHRLRHQHTFVAAFGARLAQMSTSVSPLAVDDDLRVALRSDGREGFLFLNNHRPFAPLPDREGVQVHVALGSEEIAVPHRPIALPSGEFPIWPVLLDVCGVTIRWATLSPLTLLQQDGEVATLVLTTADGVEAHLAVPTDHMVTGPVDVVRREDELVLEHIDRGHRATDISSPDGHRLRVVVLTADEALRTWTAQLDGTTRLVLTGADIVERDEVLHAVTDEPTEVSFLPSLTGEAHFSVPIVTPRHDEHQVEVELVGAASTPPHRPITVPGRASAPDDDQFRAHAAQYRISILGEASPDERSVLSVQFVGDVARSMFEGQDEDVFWNGNDWEIDITPAHPTRERFVDIAIYPLDRETPIWLPEPDASWRDKLVEPTARIDSAVTRTFTAMPLPTRPRWES